ncbi:HAD family hydrolase [Streptomyces sp. NBC_01012]|uniref:HAD family hydrolase n=1 Tax=Streptomyces sp. NBC_01012 TaxID=2903717 RepID=UPI003868B8D4|nr:HAD-IA family hydrolase [Streptomyces sp. NBC_01012]
MSEFPVQGAPFVVFDLDGVLVDTQDAENGGIAHVGELMGLRLDKEQRDELFSGKKMQECIDLMADLARTAPPQDAMAMARARCEELIGDRIEPIDGVAYAVEQLAAAWGDRMCVASNSPLAIMESRLDKAGILHHFDGRLFSAYDVDAWKPDPRLFRHAADRCGVTPDECVVVEDSPVGVDAAVAAGMRVLQYTADPATPPHREGAVTFPSMRSLPRLVRDARPTAPAPAPFAAAAHLGGVS